MKKILTIALFLVSLSIAAQEHLKTKDCAPMRNGKICYIDIVEAKGKTQAELFQLIETWANKTYGKDLFLSNVSPNKKKGLVKISSKVELLLDDKDKTRMKYKLEILCADGKYEAKMTNLSYQYDAQKDNRYRTYKAEDVIAENGKQNIVADIKDPVLFCNATAFYAQEVFSEILKTVDK